METKICTKCHAEKNIDEFRKYKKYEKNYTHTICKRCEKEKNKKYIQEHKEEIKLYKKKYTEENKEKIKEYKRNYYIDNIEIIKEKKKINYLKNKDIILKKNKIYREKNKEKLSLKSKQYYQNHKQEIIKNNTLYKKNRIKKDNLYNFKCKIRHSLDLFFYRKGLTKSKHTEEIIGMPLNEFYQYLLQTFKNNYGYEWNENEKVHIDHIIPLAVANTKEDVIKLCHYSNLQLLKAKDNLEKADKLNWKLKEVINEDNS